VLPDLWVRLIAAVVAVVLLVVLAAAVARIRRHRLPRYAAVFGAAALFMLYATRVRTGNAEVDTVQLFHFVEYGLVTWLFYRAFRPSADAAALVVPVLCGLLVGLVDEWLQWLVPIRTGEIGDVLLDGYAVVCGLLFAVGLLPPDVLRWRLSATSGRLVMRLVAATLVVAAAFFESAHGGYEIHDDETGTFRSYFTADALVRLDQARAVAWRLDPPERLPVFGIEDYYLTEAGWHVQRRNEAYTAHDFGAAWRENRILEKYYDPFLDLRSFASHERHRWAPEQRTEVEAGRHITTAVSYVSHADRGRIFVRPTAPEVWSGAVGLAGILFFCAWPRGARSGSRGE
jgi:hypothetical protein